MVGSKGAGSEKRCRSGCAVPNSINQVLQHCFITSNAKHARNNAPLRHLSVVLQRKGYEVEWKPHVRTAEGLRTTDLVATMGRLALIIDAHIVGDNVDMMAAREAKIRKYRITLV